MYYVTASDVYFEPSRAITSQTYLAIQKFQSNQIYRALHLCLQPRTHSELLSAGIEERVISTMIADGCLCVVEKEDGSHINAWERYNWSRAQRVMIDWQDNKHQTTDEHEDGSAIRSSLGIPHLQKFIGRRCSRLFEQQLVPRKLFEEATRSFCNAIRDIRWLEIFIPVQGIEGYSRSILTYCRQTDQLVTYRDSYPASELLNVVQGQWWLGGPGFCVILVVNFEKFGNVGQISSEQYISTYLTLGAVGHELLYCMYTRDLAGWMTPAIHEELASQLLTLNHPSKEALYFFKFGLPDKSAEKKYAVENLEFLKPDLENIQPYNYESRSTTP
jgi:hypothetical protein